MSFMTPIKMNEKFSATSQLNSKTKTTQFAKNCRQLSTQESLIDSDSIETSLSPFHDTSFDKITNFSIDSRDNFYSSIKENRQNQKPEFSLNKFKTEKCKNFDLFGECKFGNNCFFAHGKNELRSKTNFSDFYKTKLCRNYFKNGFCHYSSRCQYFHLKPSDAYQELCDSFVNKIYTKIMDNEVDVLTTSNESKSDSLRGRLDIFLTLNNQKNRNHSSFDLRKKIHEEVLKL